MIQVRDLSVSYGPVMGLQDLNLDIAPGECLLVTGPSGCGKSTLARALTGLIPHTIPASFSGTVHVAGMAVHRQPVALSAQTIGSVFQNPASQLFHLRVADDVAFGPRNLGLAEEEVARRVDWALDAVGGMALRHRHPAELSGGQKQLIAIAAALAMRPQVLVLDEPTASLDAGGTGKVAAALEKLRRDLGMTLVIIEHRLAEMAWLAGRILVMDGGRVVIDGGVSEVLDDRELLRRYGLRRPGDVPPAPWSKLLAPNGPPAEGVGPLAALHGVSAGYDGQPVIHDVNLALYPGEFVGLVGENGAGKTTLALVIAGLLKPTQGKLRYNAGQKQRLGLDVSLLFQDPAEQLFTDSVDEEVAFGPRNYRRFDERTHERVLAEADLESLRDRRPTALSAGQQQRTALGACLALAPGLLILDEPTLGQDWGHLEQLMTFLNTLNRNGVSILLISHDYKLVHRYARRVVLMEAGRIVLDGRLRHWDQHNDNLVDPGGEMVGIGAT